MTIGPRAPLFDGAFRPLAAPLDPDRLASFAASLLPPLLADDPVAVDAAVARAIEALSATHLRLRSGRRLRHGARRSEGRPRVAFVMNPGDGDVVARVTLGAGVTRAVDLLDDTHFEARHGALEIRMRPRTVRMLGVSG